MSKAKINKQSPTNTSNLFEVESIMNFTEMPLDIAKKKFVEKGIIVSDDEAVEILEFLHTIAKVIIKEFIYSQD